MSSESSPTPARRRGRRAGGDDTRAQLLAAAREVFAERGFDGATVRSIAERAGVDAAMVNHWFGSKEGLFSASLDFPVDPSQVVPSLLVGDPDGIGERLVTRFLEVWDSAGGGGPLAALLRSVAGSEAAARMMREFVDRAIVGRVVEVITPDRAELRAALVASQLIGLAMTRYVVRLEPLASTPRADVVASVAPTLQRYLTGPL